MLMDLKLNNSIWLPDGALDDFKSVQLKVVESISRKIMWQLIL